MRLRRALLNIVTVASAASCMAVAAAWARSYLAYDFVTATRDHPGTGQWLRQIYDARTGRGGVAAEYYWSWTADPAGIAGFRQAHAVEPAVMVVHEPPRDVPFGSGGYPQPGVARRLGFEFDAGWLPPFGAGRVWQARAVVPFWLPTAALGLLPAWRLARRGRRRLPGACQSCGYDLRASPGRCPECGAVRAEGDHRL
jgi:hypothetical protein